MNTLPNLEIGWSVHTALSLLIVPVSFLASNFIEGAQNPHIKNKLRSYQVKNLKELFGHAIQEDQKQKISVLDFRVSPKKDPILNCTVNAIQGKACFKCGSEDYFIKDCP